MVRDIAYYLVFGKPVIFYLGIITFILFAMAALVPILNRKEITHFEFPKRHHQLVALAFISALIHAVLALSAYLNF